MQAAKPLAELDSALGQLGAKAVLAGCLLLIASLHLPLLAYPLVYDDGWVLITNGFLREPDLGLLLSPEAIRLHVPDAFRPTSVLFDILSYRAFGLHAATHHLVSISLHLGVCALLFAWLRTLGAHLHLSAATTLLFGVMGLHAEVVAVVSYREDLLAAVFGLAGLVCASHYLRRPGITRVQLVPIALVLGLSQVLACGAKLSAAPLPLCWLLAEALDPFAPSASAGSAANATPAASGRVRLVLFIALCAGVACALAHRVSMTGSLSPYLDPGGEQSFDPRLLSERVGHLSVLAASLQIQLAYLGQSLLPLNLSPEYANFGSSFRHGATLLATMAWLCLLLVALVCTRGGPDRRLFAWAVLAGVALLLPTSNVVPMPNMRADRFTYLASIPAALAWSALAMRLGVLVSERLDRAGAWMWALSPLLALCLVQASLERAATSAFYSNTTLWDTASRRAPNSARARAMQGLMRLSAGDGRAARDPALAAKVHADCEWAQVLDPLEARVHVCFARLAGERGELAEAHARFTQAIELDPRHSANWLGARASLAFEQARTTSPSFGSPRREDARSLELRQARAMAEIDAAIAQFPYAEELHLVAGRLAHRLGHPQLAERHYRRARSLRPERWESVAAMLELQLDLGHIRRAHQLWRQEAKLLRHAHPTTRAHLRSLLRDGDKLGLKPSGKNDPFFQP